MARQKSFKKQKFAEKIQNELNSFLRYNTNDSRFQFVSITRVDVTDDQTRAEVYWDTFKTESKEEIESAVNKMSGKLRTHLSQKLETRTVPEIILKYDSQYEAEMEITNLLNKEKERFGEDS